jgi:upstream activation factor subunit UAF30
MPQPVLSRVSPLLKNEKKRFTTERGTATTLSMATKKKSSRKPNAAFLKPVQPDAKLAVIVGSKPLPRTELTKKLWVYIKKNGLQDKKNKRMVNADEAFKEIFKGKKQVNIFELTKLVSTHVS